MPSCHDAAYERMCATIERRSLLPFGGGALLMVSGGSDSTALAYLMARYRDEHPERMSAMAMMHMNHQLRGKAADDDAAFVQSLADSLHIPLFICEMDIAAEAARCGGNVEAVARRERYAAAYEALMSMCQHEGVPTADARIFTAHTVDDRMESFYMRSIVGTGPGGFRGMLFENGSVARPLLECTREELRGYICSLGERVAGDGDVDGAAAGEGGDAAGDGDGAGCGAAAGEGDASADAASWQVPVEDSEGAFWREDATNAHTDRFRAYVRHEVVPKAREWNPSVATTLARTMDLIADEDDMLHEMALELLDFASEAISEESILDGAVLLPEFGSARKPLQRRSIHELFKMMLGAEARVDSAAVDAVLAAFSEEVPHAPKGGYVANVQGDLAVSANKKGVRIEPMGAFRARRKRG